MHPVLPTTERRNTTYRNTLHARYLVGLLPPERQLDRPYYRGDIYHDEATKWAEEWERQTQGAYIDRIRKSLKLYPELCHLRDWMEVTTAVARHTYLNENPQERSERAHRVRVTQIDYKQGNEPQRHEFTNTTSLREALESVHGSTGHLDARIYVVEDLSRDVIELLGSKQNVDPHFFRSHLNDYMWQTVAGDAVEPRNLDVVNRKRPHFTFQYLRSRYYESTKLFEKALEQAAIFNVLRQLDSDRSREHLMNSEGAAVCLMRAKISLWWTRAESSNETMAVGILLVDPTPADGYALWGGNTSLTDWTTITDFDRATASPRTSLYDDLVYWMCQIGDGEVAQMRMDPRVLGVPALKLMLSDWHHVIQYMISQIAQIEWEIELPDWGRSTRYVDDKIMRKLHPWRRNIFLYRTMITDAIHKLYPPYSSAQFGPDDRENSLESLRPDFQLILDDIDTIQTRIAQLVSVATAFQSLDESRRAMDQNNNVARLTYLATLFIPLSFVSGFLSMVPDVSELRQTIWIFFAIAVPLTAVALVAADFLHLRRNLLQVLLSKTKQG